MVKLRVWQTGGSGRGNGSNEGAGDVPKDAETHLAIAGSTRSQEKTAAEDLPVHP